MNRFKTLLIASLFLTMQIIQTAIPNSIIQTIGNQSLNHPVGIAIHPSGTTAYVCNSGNSTVEIVDVATNNVIAAITDTEELINNPQDIAITPDGQTAYVCNYNSDFGNIVIINLYYRTVTGVVSNTQSTNFNGLASIAITPDGHTAYVCSQNNQTVFIIDINPANVGTTYNTAIGTVTDSPQTFYAPYAIAITPNGNTAYVCNFYDNSVSIIDINPANVGSTYNTVIGTVTDQVPSTFNNPYAIAITPNGSTAYVCNFYDNSVSIIDTNSTSGTYNTVIGTVTDQVPSTFNIPYAIAITPNGSTAYVCNYNNNSVSIIDTNSNSGTYNTVIGTVSDQDPSTFNIPGGIAIAPDGNKAYVCNLDGNSLSIIDTNSTHTLTYNHVINVIQNSIPFVQPYGIAITPDGLTAYVTNFDGNSVSIIDIATNIVTGFVTDTDATFSNPQAIAITPNGRTAYVCNRDSNTVSVINLEEQAVAESLIMGDISAPQAIAITPDGTKAYVCNSNSDTVRIINTSDNTVDNTIISVGPNPIAIAITPDGTTAYVVTSDESYINIIDLNNNTVVENTISVGNYPVSIAITFDGTTAYVCNQNDNTVSIIDLATNIVTGTLNDPANTVQNPSAVVLSAYGVAGYILNHTENNYDSISIFNTTTNSVTDMIINNSLQNPQSMAFTPDGIMGYICNANNNLVSIMYRQTPTITPAAMNIKTRVQRNPTYVDYNNTITWKAPASGEQIACYKIYRDPYMNHLIATIDVSKPYMYTDHNLLPDTTYTYYLASQDNEGNLSAPRNASMTTLP
jgi:YVTN family beta-propeller protein